jgi:hypothetical protein
MVVPVRGIVHPSYIIKYCNSIISRLGLLPYQINGHHNLCETHTDSRNNAKSLFNVSKYFGIRKGSIVQNAVDTSVSSEDYYTLYRFPYIQVCGIVNKLKKHLTIVTVAGVPVSALLQLMDVVSSGTTTVFIAVGMICNFSGELLCSSKSLYFFHCVIV